MEVQKTGKKLREIVEQYYEALAQRFPHCIQWDGETFHYADWEVPEVFDYHPFEGDVAFSPTMFGRDEYKRLQAMFEAIPKDGTTDMVITIPGLGVKVPLMNIKRYSIWWFRGDPSYD